MKAYFGGRGGGKNLFDFGGNLTPFGRRVAACIWWRVRLDAVCRGAQLQIGYDR